MDAARIRTFSRVSLPSLLLFPTFFTLFHPLSTILRSLLVSTLSSLPLFHSPLSSQFSSRFFLALAISRNMRLHSAVRPNISFPLFLAIVIHERIYFFLKKKEKKERKQRDQRKKEANFDDSRHLNGNDELSRIRHFRDRSDCTFCKKVW